MICRGGVEIGLPGLISTDSISGMTLRLWRFLLTWPLGVSTRYDHGVSTDALTRLGVSDLLEVIYTSVSSGIGGNKWTLWYQS